jgi:hypothetical protein
MTAEIAIFNRSAVALAADSAVTIGDGGKIYNSANKLFTLSKYHPVGVMVYGRASVMSVPWETVIKLYRSHLGEKELPTVAEYAKDFLSFLESSQTLFPESQQQSNVEGFLINRLDNLRNDIIKTVEERIKQKGKFSESETAALVESKISEHVEFLKSLKALPTLPPNFGRDACAKYAQSIKEISTEVFESKLPFTGKASALLSEFLVLQFEKDTLAELTGLVIAGFGKDEYFPAGEAFVIDSVVNGRLRYKREGDKSYAVNFENSASIIPFAQSEMAETFLRGYNPRFYRVISGYLKRLVAKYPETITKSMKDPAEISAVKELLKNQSQEILDSFTQEIKTFSREYNWGPIIDAVEVLSKDDLASMAESLINLTSFKRKVTMSERETVGGPIDVAVISKGDGFIWIKRKHYFQQELNQHFMRNYYRRGKDEAAGA